MTLQKLAEETARDIAGDLGADPDKVSAITRRVEDALIKAIGDVHARTHAAMSDHIAPPMRSALRSTYVLWHTFAGDRQAREQALIANLCSLR